MTGDGDEVRAVALRHFDGPTRAAGNLHARLVGRHHRLAAVA